MQGPAQAGADRKNSNARIAHIYNVFERRDKPRRTHFRVYSLFSELPPIAAS